MGKNQIKNQIKSLKKEIEEIKILLQNNLMLKQPEQFSLGALQLTSSIFDVVELSNLGINILKNKDVKKYLNYLEIQNIIGGEKSYIN